MTTATTCGTCGTEPLEDARFCHSCGSPISPETRPAEYKQVTVLFADVVHSMDIASAVGAERLREIMTELFNRCSGMVQRYGGTVDKFTGDGIMALFGAPVALEDHAFRACLAALDIQDQATELAVEVQRQDRIDFLLRVGLNSGQVIAGEIDSTPTSYTAIGVQVGMAQRMESVAPPGGVMLSESTARLVEDVATLGEPELVDIKGAADAVRARRLLAASSDRRHTGRQDPALVGRSWEMGALTGMLDAAIDGTGCVVGLVGPPGIGKSRIAREITTLAQRRDVEVFAAYCESHASEIPFHTVTSLLRTALGAVGLGDEAVRARVRERAPVADPKDLLILDDLLGIGDSSVELAAINPAARLRRLTRLVNTISLARTTPAVYVVEDVHWIDEVSDLLLADFVAVAPQTRSLVLITYRPEYRGALTRTPNSQTITLAPLNAGLSATLATELIGSHPSVTTISMQVAERAAGNPFFAEEIVRDLAERGVLTGGRGNYVCGSNDADAAVPATLHATIAARIDRLSPAIKQTLYAAAVIGLRFTADQLALLDGDAEMGKLIEAELVDQVRFIPYAEYAFHHPLIRTVAYESQLKSDRAELHRRLAVAIQQNRPSADENAALIAEHFEAAEDLRAAFDWHMRAGTWAHNRDIGAARVSWERARAVADRLPVDDPDRTSMRIAPRTLLCSSTFRIGGNVTQTGFDELRDLCTAAGDKVSLAIGMAGLLTTLAFYNQYRQSSSVSSDCSRLLESIGDPMLILGLSIAPSNVKFQAGEATEGLRLAQRVIDLAEGDPTKGALVIGSPLATATALRGSNRYCLGLPGWKEDLNRGVAMARTVDTTSHIATVLWKYGFAVQVGAVQPDAVADRDTAEALEIAESSGDDFAVNSARVSRGLVLIHQGDSQRAAGLALIAQYREAHQRHGYAQSAVRFADAEIAREKARVGDVDGAIALARAIVNHLFDAGEMITRAAATAVLVESLLQRGSPADLTDAQAAIDRLAAVPTDPGFVLFEIPLLRLRALMARANSDEVGYREFAECYRKRANDVGYEGHMALAEEMVNPR
jgi:adenylate cyclase